MVCGCLSVDAVARRVRRKRDIQVGEFDKAANLLALCRRRFHERPFQQPVTDTEKKYVYGILGIAKLFGCSLPTANRIKKSGKIDKAITQIGRKIIVDAELALELAGKKTGGRK